MRIALRQDFDAAMTRKAARLSKDAGQTRRLLALAMIYDGASRTQAAQMGGVTLQIIRDWVMKFNAHGPSGLIDRKPPGKPPRLRANHHAALIRMIEEGPDPEVDGVVRWRLVDLVRRLEEDFQLEVSIQTLSRELRRLGFRKLSARPRHQAQDPLAMEAFKKGALMQSF